VQGRLIAGRYRLVSLLGRGGMGSVWRAVHVELGTPAAVKLLDPGAASSPEDAQRFKREACAAASLRGAHIVQIFDYGVDQGDPYIAMELLEGETLGQRLARVRKLDPKTTARLLSDVGKAVSRAHAAGIVHRDLTPDNVFLSRQDGEEVVCVLDFGIAKDLSSRLGIPSRETCTGTILGTPHYMSPEQAAGERTVGVQTDIWALTAIAFECLVGQPPFSGETFGELILAISKGPIPVPSSLATVPSGFDEWFERGIRRDPAERFPSVKLAMAALRAVCGLRAREDDSTAELLQRESALTIRMVHADLPVGARLRGVHARRVMGSAAKTVKRWSKPRLVLALTGLAIVGATLGAWRLRHRLPRFVQEAEPTAPATAMPAVGSQARRAPQQGSTAVPLVSPVDRDSGTARTQASRTKKTRATARVQRVTTTGASKNPRPTKPSHGTEVAATPSVASADGSGSDPQVPSNSESVPTDRWALSACCSETTPAPNPSAPEE
jgi:serine/threonine-protein kinase